MNDEDIKKALECCLEPKHDCSYCLLEKEVYCTSMLHKNILDLINRQQAEIDRQQLEIEKLKELLKEWKKAAYKYADSIENIKSEAIKEFADLSIKRICEQVSAPTPSESYIVEKCNETIDNLLAEMVGEQNA